MSYQTAFQSNAFQRDAFQIARAVGISGGFARRRIKEIELIIQEKPDNIKLELEKYFKEITCEFLIKENEDLLTSIIRKHTWKFITPIIEKPKAEIKKSKKVEEKKVEVKKVEIISRFELIEKADNIQLKIIKIEQGRDYKKDEEEFIITMLLVA